jgi:hypothetical protein
VLLIRNSGKAILQPARLSKPFRESRFHTGKTSEIVSFFAPKHLIIAVKSQAA